MTNSGNKNYAAEAAMKCQEALFVQFLADSTDVPSDAPNFARDALYKICRISSRKQLNTEPAAQEQWLTVKKWFGLWRLGYGKDERGQKRPPFLMGQKAFERGASRDENPYDIQDKTGIYPFPYEMWRSGWLNQKGISRASDIQRPGE